MTSIFDKIPMREKDLSKRAIYLMRACVVLYLASAAGLFLLQVDDMAHSTFGKYIYFALALAILGTAVCFCTNRLWWRIGFPDKYLDEWEIQLRSIHRK